MATPSENHKLVSDYYAAYGNGGPEGIARMMGFYAENKTGYVSGNSEISGSVSDNEGAVRHYMRLQELTGGDISLVVPPQILLAGDKVVAAIIYERHVRIGKEPLIVPRLCVYEIEDGKLAKGFAWQLESQAYDEYYPRS